jgi:hypothetical protein
MRWVGLIGLTLVMVLIGLIYWRSLAVSSGGTQEPHSPENVVSSGGETHRTTPSTSQAQRPEEIVSVFPEENSTACPRTEISARFSLKGEMLKDGQMHTKAFSLILDGEDVTAKTDIRSTMDFPQSQGTIFYRSEKSLSLERHEATVAFPDAATGETQTYTWTFDAQEIGCQ